PRHGRRRSQTARRDDQGADACDHRFRGDGTGSRNERADGREPPPRHHPRNGARSDGLGSPFRRGGHGDRGPFGRGDGGAARSPPADGGGAWSEGRPMTSVLHRESGKDYPLAVGGEGMYLRDDRGRQYLDMSGGAAVSCLGHGHPGVIAAIKAQAERLAFAHTSFFSNAPQEELAEVIAGRFAEPGAKVFFTCDGSEANETALKLAWQYWQRLGKPEKRIVISRRFSYHGNTLGALSVSGNPARRAASEHVLHDWPRIAPCFAWRHQKPGETEADYGLRAARELEAAILAAGAENVAAFIAEPVSGASLGAVPAATGYFREIREICDRYGVLLILDEVMTGAGRTGSYFAYEQEGIEPVVPDIVTLAKGLSGGYLPLGATLARASVHEVFARQSFAHGHTYVGHALSCAAALAVQQALESEGLLA